MSINLSARQFADENLPRDLASILKKTGVEPRLLELGVTESVLLADVDRAVAILEQIRALGVRVAIDNFGASYSSLSTLNRFRFDTVNIDGSVIRDYAHSPEDRKLTEATIAMGKNLAFTVVAEGVETEAQAQFLRDSACDKAQGFYFGRPAPRDPGAYDGLARRARSGLQLPICEPSENCGNPAAAGDHRAAKLRFYPIFAWRAPEFRMDSCSASLDARRRLSGLCRAAWPAPARRATFRNRARADLTWQPTVVITCMYRTLGALTAMVLLAVSGAAACADTPPPTPLEAAGYQPPQHVRRNLGLPRYAGRARSGPGAHGRARAQRAGPADRSAGARGADGARRARRD